MNRKQMEVECKKKLVTNETPKDFGVEYLVAVWKIVAILWFSGSGY